jgi:hypothetical protein
MFGIEVMQAYKHGQADIPSLLPVFHVMLVKIAHFDQFRRKISGADHLQGKQYDYQFPHAVNVGIMVQKKNVICHLGAICLAYHARFMLFLRRRAGGILPG